ncbi:MAG: SIS domain-containing protein [Anaerolineae bacterium]
MPDWIEQLGAKYPDLFPCLPDVERAYVTLRDAFAAGKKLLICGNGGSAADSEHIVGELMKGFYHNRPLPAATREALLAGDPEMGRVLAERLQGALPAISLVSQTALITAFANDVDPDLVFAQQVLGYGQRGDVLMGISTSGNSRNVLYALHTARALGMRTIGVTGQSGGRMPGFADVTIRVPATRTAEIQERHLAVYHALCAQLEEDLFAEDVIVQMHNQGS